MRSYTRSGRAFRRLAATAGLVALVASACSSADDPSDDGPRIVVTTGVWGDVVSNVAGDAAVVEVVIPVGADPHDYSPSSQQVASMQEADLVVANGLGLEEGLEDVLSAIVGDGGAVIELAPQLDPQPFSGDGHADDHEGEDDGHDHDGDDPHAWMDPVRVADAAMLVAEALESVTPGPWIELAETYASEVLAAHEGAVETFGTLAPDAKKLVTSHDALGYFADRYGFTIVGVVIPGGSTLADPSSAEIAELVETMEREDVTTIFGETSSSSALAEVVAAELGEEVSVVELYTGSLGESGSGADTVIGMIETNARLIVDALG
jgi:zinc/manganese transport system substrate-binding protein